MRLDKYLKVSRLIKRRTVANEACDGGRVTVNGKVARASYDVKVGDVRRARARGRGARYIRDRRQERGLAPLPRSERTVNRTILGAPFIRYRMEGAFFAPKAKGRVLTMTYDTSPASPQRIELSGRESLTVSGVEDVDRFDEAEIVMNTSLGVLVVTGDSLHIGKLSLDGGELHVDGRIDAIAFEDAPSSRGGLLSRLFGG